MISSFFSKYFPIPRYLRMAGIGISMSGDSVRYVELTKHGNHLAVANYGKQDIPKDVFIEGVLKNPEKIKPALREIRSEVHTPFAVVSLPEEQAFLSTIRLPMLTDEDEIRSALELKIEDNIPLKAEEAIFDFQIMKQSEEETVASVIALSRILVEGYRNAVVSAGFIPTAFEMEAQPLARAVVKHSITEPTIVINFGKTHTSLIVVHNRHVRFTTTVAIGGDDLTKSIMKNLGVDATEANRTKKENGFVRSSENENVFHALLPPISAIKEEVEKLILYWASHSGDIHTAITGIIISGGSARLKGLKEYFSYELKIHVTHANPWVNIVSFNEYIPDIPAHDAIAYTTSIGLGIRASGYYDTL